MSAALDLNGQYSRQKYNQILKFIKERIENLAFIKGAEYAHGDDRLDNFRRNAKNLGIPAEVVWAVYTAKHWDAINTYIKDIATDTNHTRSEPMTERALDMIVYLTLFIAMEDEKASLRSAT